MHDRSADTSARLVESADRELFVVTADVEVAVQRLELGVVPCDFGRCGVAAPQPLPRSVRPARVRPREFGEELTARSHLRPRSGREWVVSSNAPGETSQVLARRALKKCGRPS